ncbi:MAG: DUF924 family protein [Pseudomonadota bacterium]
MAALKESTPEGAIAVLHFWFLELMPEQWFSSSDELDQGIAERFGGLLEQAKRGELDHWAETPRGLLALVIVLDQFSRNIHRGDGKAFAQDKKAQKLTLRAIETEMDERLGMDERQFLYMPLMHAEDRELQVLGVTKLEALANSAASVTEFARKHQDIVDRFGRFPYRNPMIGRASTPDEQAFIDEAGNPFS